MSQIINWCEEHEESGGEACWYWEANKTWERPCHMVERIVVNPSDALIIRRDENGHAVRTNPSQWTCWPEWALDILIKWGADEAADYHPHAVLDALASSQGVEP